MIERKEIDKKERKKEKSIEELCYYVIKKVNNLLTKLPNELRTFPSAVKGSI